MPLLIKPHLNPSTLRSQFSPEPSLPPLGWSQRTTFDSESSSLPRPHPIPFVAEDQSSPSQAASRNDNSNRNHYIPKPKGEFNRPSNGYCLEAMCKDVLNWDSDRWSQVEHFVGTLVDDHLDNSLSRTHQTVEKRELVHQKMIQKFSFFAQFDKVPGSFENNWLLNDLIARRLKKKDTPKESRSSSKTKQGNP